MPSVTDVHELTSGVVAAETESGKLFAGRSNLVVWREI